MKWRSLGLCATALAVIGACAANRPDLAVGRPAPGNEALRAALQVVLLQEQDPHESITILRVAHSSLLEGAGVEVWDDLSVWASQLALVASDSAFEAPLEGELQMVVSRSTGCARQSEECFSVRAMRIGHGVSYLVGVGRDGKDAHVERRAP